MKRIGVTLFAVALGLAGAVAVRADRPAPVQQAVIDGPAMPRTLSELGFFAGSPDRPADSLIAYELGNPLFSDYAEKHRYIHLPQGAAIKVGADGRIAFPVGAALIKNFGYRDGSGRLDTLETRVFLHRADGWLALPYVWNEARTDAVLKVAGARMPVSFADPSGERLDISYAVPNKNQCKQCHSRDGELSPIGPVWQEMVFPRAADRKRLMDGAWFAKDGLFAQARWDDPAKPLAERAGAYLNANCAHCHSRTGAASNSGLFYDEPVGSHPASGYLKRPVAAGRGSGSFEFIIEPGHPERSILLYRMHSLDPGVAMPEIGRATVHKEGMDLLTRWIAEME